MAKKKAKLAGPNTPPDAYYPADGSYQKYEKPAESITDGKPAPDAFHRAVAEQVGAVTRAEEEAFQRAIYQDAMRTIRSPIKNERLKESRAAAREIAKGKG